MSRLKIESNLSALQSRLSHLREQDSQGDRRRLAFTVGGLIFVMAFGIPACSFIGGPRMARGTPGFSEALIVTAFVLSLVIYIGGILWLKSRDLDGELIGRAERLLEAVKPVARAASEAKLSVDLGQLQRADLLVDSLDEGINTGLTGSVKVDTYRQTWVELALPLSNGALLELFATRALIVTTRSQGKSESTEQEAKDQLVIRVVPGDDRQTQAVSALHQSLIASPHIEMQSAEITGAVLEISLAESPRSSFGASPVRFWLDWFVDKVTHAPPPP